MTKVSIEFHSDSQVGITILIHFIGLRQRYFGTGETFIFKFDKSSLMTKYEWVNKDQSDDEDEIRKRDVSKELFMSADRTMITVGGG